MLLAGSTGYAVSLSLCPTEFSTTPEPGTPTYAVLCPRARLTEHLQCVTNSSCELQSNPSIILGKVFPHPVKAGSYVVLLSRAVGEVTSATQQQSKPLAIMSPPPSPGRATPHTFLVSSLAQPSWDLTFVRRHSTTIPLFPLMTHSCPPVYANALHTQSLCSGYRYYPHDIRSHCLGEISGYLGSLLQAWPLNGLLSKTTQGSQKSFPRPPWVAVLNFNYQSSRLGYQTKQSVPFPGVEETQLIRSAKNLLAVY